MSNIQKRYKKWLKLRENSEDEYGEKLCYCGHTKMCECGDPTLEMFEDHILNGNITEDDINNKWEKVLEKD